MSYQRRVLATGTSFRIEKQGLWTLADVNADGTLDLCRIRTRDTASGKVEVHYTTSESRFQSAYTVIPTVYPLSDAENGHFHLQDFTGDGRADLVFLKKRNTGTNTIEVHVASADSGYQKYVWQSGTCFDVEDNGFWYLTDMKDLVYIKINNTSTGMVEYHAASHASDYKKRIVGTATCFKPERHGFWCLAPKTHPVTKLLAWGFSCNDWGDGSLTLPDLYYVKTRDTDSGMVEVHAASSASRWQKKVVTVETSLAPEQDGHYFMADWTHQLRPDLVYVKYRNTGTNTVEVHVVESQRYRPRSYVGESRNVSLQGAVLHAELQRNDQSWHAASIELDKYVSNVNGQFEWNGGGFSQTASDIALQGSVLTAKLRRRDGGWTSASYDLAKNLMNNDGAFQALNVPCLLGLPKDQELEFLDNLASGMTYPDFKLQARDEPDGSTLFYANASIEVSKGILFRTYSAEAKAAVYRMAIETDNAWETLELEFLQANVAASAWTIGPGGQSVGGGVEASVNLYKGKASIFDVTLGLGVDTGGGFRNGSVEVELAGCGVTIGVVTSVSIFGTSIGIDFGRIFDFDL